MENTESLLASQKPSDRSFEKKLSQMSPFEIKNDLINYAKNAQRHGVDTLLNAGRGNPNWINTIPRQALFLIGEFGIAEGRRTMDMPEFNLAGMPEQEGIAARFLKFLDDDKSHDPHVVNFLRDAYDWCLRNGVDADELVFEWTDGVIGDEYPMPDRILKNTEIIVRRYLEQEMCDNHPRATFDLFATEGGTAAMCYLFNSLQANKLLKKGDHIALMTPIFTPYIEIPQLKEFDLKVTNINASSRTEEGLHTWQYPDSQLEKLRIRPSVCPPGAGTRCQRRRLYRNLHLRQFIQHRRSNQGVQGERNPDRVYDRGKAMPDGRGRHRHQSAQHLNSAHSGMSDHDWSYHLLHC